MQYPSALIDREREVAELRRLASSGQKHLGILYGRRQIGKTHLLSHAWGHAPGSATEARAASDEPGGATGDRGVRQFYFLAAALTPDLNRHDLVRELAAWSGRPFDPDDYPTWRTVFRELIGLARDGPIVIVLDEFQYLLGDASGGSAGDQVTSQLVAVWDRAPRDLPLTLVLSGSEVSAMAHLQGGGEPLYGRVTWSAQLSPFDYRDAARMAPWLAPRDRVYLYSIFGGTPRYLAALNEGESLPDGVARTFLSPHGEVHLQLLTLIEQEKGIRQPADYRAVLTAVATGHTQFNAIAQATGLEDHAVRRALGVLGDLDLVQATRNFDAGAKAPYRYVIVDHAVRFWHHFVVPNRSRLATDDPRFFWDTRVAPHLDSYAGHTFETIVCQAYARSCRRWGLPAAREWSRWEGKDRNGESIEIDAVARLDDGRLLVGEVKWSSSLSGPGLHTDLLGKLARLAASGHGWARGAEEAVFLYVSAAGFTPQSGALAAADPRIRLLSLPDLYADGAADRA